MANAILVLAALAGCEGMFNNTPTDSSVPVVDTGTQVTDKQTAALRVFSWSVNEPGSDTDDELEASTVVVTNPQGDVTVGETNPDSGEASAEIVVGESTWVHAGQPDVTDSQQNPLYVDGTGQRWASVGEYLTATNATPVEYDVWWNFYTHIIADRCERVRYDDQGDYFDTIDCGNPEVEVVEDTLVNYDDETFGGFISSDDNLEVFGADVNVISDYDVWIDDSEMSVNTETGRTTIRALVERSDGTSSELFVEGYEL